ncbi:MULTISPECIES: hypothetical protein [unclassified Micromonospora]|uniref:hypothetical protein n=1 Tax=unclassified Micromonospora TaxID=2617518 RepID=UPI000A012E58|nr:MULTISPECIES: hypothetical protein [unclassified Micromonospora]MCK1805343.1 hypothetical protein [Micromonospora sp. R42106]MCK1830797.1 hypothetical protein [Micromonospora sp. R42003]MCK1842463.1 hypothetical protein [Micromonospora sp. R42004]MCM1015848.1 hypothetical protein [Micromonospora sp. XM-20-01]NHO83322.1 hypothetical protein [Micromonospora sp. CMU55-4]
MLLPGSFKTAYEAIIPDLEQGVEYVRSRLHAELAEFRPVVIQVRRKEAESLYAKLQKGEAASIFDVEDLIAARGVFLHTAEAQNAMTTAERVFPPIEAKNVEAGKPTDFRYQQPHLICRLPNDYLARHPNLTQLKIEVQFTTYVQHALQESTHDVIYKGQRFSWREHRLDGRLRGLLEIVDDVLANVSSVANIGDEPNYELFDARNRIIEAARESFADSSLPDDMRRFAITVEGILQAAEISPAELVEFMNRHADIAQAFSLTPVDKVLGIALRERREKLLSRSKRRLFLVTPELETVVPEAKTIPAGQRVKV